MQKQVTIFEDARFGQIRTSVSENGEPLFCLADVCKALDLGNPSQVKQRLSVGGVISNEVGVKTGTRADGTPAMQNVPMTFINEPNLYKCIFQSRKKEAEQFQDWVFGEVLPSIRKSGGYIEKKETKEQLLSRALLLAQETLEEQSKVIAEGMETMKAMQPLVNFAKSVQDSGDSILVGEMAKILRQNGVDMGQNRLFTWLRENGYLCSLGERYNQPTQKAMDLGLFEIKKTAVLKPSGETFVTFTPKVTGKGQVYFLNKFV